MDSNNQIKPDEIEILIVEDSPTQAERLRRLIQSLHDNARVAANGQLALAAIRERKPHLVLSDIVMPEMNGYDLCRAIKSDPTLRDIPVILVTSLNDPKDIIRQLSKLRLVESDYDLPEMPEFPGMMLEGPTTVMELHPTR